MENNDLSGSIFGPKPPHKRFELEHEKGSSEIIDPKKNPEYAKEQATKAKAKALEILAKAEAFALATIQDKTEKGYAGAACSSSKGPLEIMALINAMDDLKKGMEKQMFESMKSGFSSEDATDEI